MNIKRLTFFVAAASLLAGCATASRKAAPVVDHGPAPASKTASVEAAKPKQPEARSAENRPPEGRGYYTVKKGDTLYRIALEFGQNWRDLVAWNQLQNANDIKIDQTLRVLPPDTGATASAAVTGPQTGSLSSGAAVEVKPLGNPNPQNVTVPNKTAPRGEKRPYSEINLAELQKADAEGVQPANQPRSDPKSSPGAEPKTTNKQNDLANGGNAAGADETINWIWPAEGKVIATFSGNRKGIDIAGKLGQPIYAAGAGKVLYASSMRGFGNLVIVKHTENLLSAYAHNKTIVVKEGQTVSRGQKIAEMGDSDTNAVKLHFEIRRQGKPVDPSKFLPSR